MTSELLGWPPVLWTARIVLLILLLGGGWCAILYFLRFVRKKHIAAMWNARLPRLRKFGGSIAGQEFGLDLDQDQDEQFEAVMRRLNELESKQDLDREAIQEVVRYLLGKEAQHDFFNR